jgi:hypothetical protein
VAALIAPRPLLIGNSDKDRLFPLDGVVRLYETTRRLYGLYGETNNLGLLITDGPHADTQDLQLPVFSWFNRFLKGQRPIIEMAATPQLPAADLKVFKTLPADAINPTVQESFGPAAAGSKRDRAAVLAALKEKCFAGWPAPAPAPVTTLARTAEKDGLRLQVYDFVSQPLVPLRLYVCESTAHRPRGVILTALDAAGWAHWLAAVRAPFAKALADEIAPTPASGSARPQGWPELKRELETNRMALAFVAPRGLGSGAWSGPEKRQTSIRRRFMLLGQTLDGMRVWDIRCAAEALRSIPELKAAPLTLRGRGEMGVNVLYAALFEPGIARVELADLPRSHRQGPDYLNVLQVVDIPEALRLLPPKVELISN